MVQKQHRHAEGQDALIAAQEETIAAEHRHAEEQDRIIQALSARLDQMQGAHAQNK